MHQRVVVAGGGPAGLCLAIALAQRGFGVDVVERQSAGTLAKPAFDGREVALTRTSIQLLQALGIWERVDWRQAAPVERARIMDGDDRGFVVDSRSVENDRLGALVSNGAIRAAAWEAALACPAIQVRDGVSVERIDTGVAESAVLLSDGSTLHAPLVVAADGRFSALRRMQGIAATLHDFGMTMLLVRARHAVSNERTAWEWFGHGQTRALLPLEPHLSSLVLTVNSAEVPALLALPADALAAELATRYEGRLGDLTLASTVHAYPLVATWAHRFVAARFALAGDAAIGMHPVTAHGFNLGLASVRHLADAAADGWRRHGDPGHARTLARYQRRLRASGALIFAGTQAVAHLFTDDRPLARPVRHALLLAGRTLPPLRRALAVHVTAELPWRASPLRHVRGVVRTLRPRRHGAGGVRDFSQQAQE